MNLKRIPTLISFATIIGIAIAGVAMAAADNSTSGECVLPSGGNDGFVSGTLLDDASNVLFTLEADLVETSSKGRRKGTMIGVLVDTEGNDAFRVSGTWNVNKRGRGSFEGLIRGFPPGVFPVGDISGSVKEPDYTGTWSIITL